MLEHSNINILDHYAVKPFDHQMFAKADLLILLVIRFQALD